VCRLPSTRRDWRRPNAARSVRQSGSVPVSGVAFVDESYLREAILNPSATVAMGFTPVMPTFAGQLTEQELQALIVYVASLSVLVQEQRR
jgi:cytochrome c1